MPLTISPAGKSGNILRNISPQAAGKRRSAYGAPPFAGRQELQPGSLSLYNGFTMSEPTTLSLHALPQAAARIVQDTPVPPPLLAHLILVHDVAVRLATGVRRLWPALIFDVEAVAFGAATHDLGKLLHPEEMTGPGEAHRKAGPEFLIEEYGVDPALARFARTHGNWQAAADLVPEDLLVALADQIWKGSRPRSLEEMLIAWIAGATGQERWEVFMALDELLTALAADADKRLLWQAQYMPSREAAEDGTFQPASTPTDDEDPAAG